jgi:hypothetical protein
VLDLGEEERKKGAEKEEVREGNNIGVRTLCIFAGTN